MSERTDSLPPLALDDAHLVSRENADLLRVGKAPDIKLLPAGPAFTAHYRRAWEWRVAVGALRAVGSSFKHS